MLLGLGSANTHIQQVHMLPLDLGPDADAFAEALQGVGKLLG
jgi:hypothetical protein